MFYYKGGREIPVFDIGPCKVGIVICYDNQFPEIARVLALRGAEVILMPHAGRFKLWDDTPESEAAARRYSHNFLKKYALRARENACFAILTDQVGRAGYVDLWPRDSENQPHHAGAALIWGPDGELIASTQEERIREEMIVATLDAALMARERALANYMLRTRRPELFDELAARADQLLIVSGILERPRMAHRLLTRQVCTWRRNRVHGDAPAPCRADRGVPRDGAAHPARRWCGRRGCPAEQDIRQDDDHHGLGPGRRAWRSISAGD